VPHRGEGSGSIRVNGSLIPEVIGGEGRQLHLAMSRREIIERLRLAPDMAFEVSGLLGEDTKFAGRCGVTLVGVEELLAREELERRNRALVLPGFDGQGQAIVEAPAHDATLHQRDNPWLTTRPPGTTAKGGRKEVRPELTADKTAVTPLALRIHPNPFNPQTEIAFDLPSEQRVALVVYSATGRRVQTLLSRTLAAGSHEVMWRGTDDDGNRVGSGIYFCRLVSSDGELTRKMVLLK